MLGLGPDSTPCVDFKSLHIRKAIQLPFSVSFSASSRQMHLDLTVSLTDSQVGAISNTRSLADRNITPQYLF